MYCEYTNKIMEWVSKRNRLLGNKQNQPSEFRAKICVWINDDKYGMYNANSQSVKHCNAVML